MNVWQTKLFFFALSFADVEQRYLFSQTVHSQIYILTTSVSDAEWFIKWFIEYLTNLYFPCFSSLNINRYHRRWCNNTKNYISGNHLLVIPETFCSIKTPLNKEIGEIAFQKTERLSALNFSSNSCNIAEGFYFKVIVYNGIMAVRNCALIISLRCHLPNFCQP